MTEIDMGADEHPAGSIEAINRDLAGHAYAEELPISEGLRTLLAEGSIREATPEEERAGTHNAVLISPFELRRILSASLPAPLVPATIKLQNDTLRYVDVSAKNLTAEQQQQIFEECRVNPAYFFHTVVRTPIR